MLKNAQRASACYTDYAGGCATSARHRTVNLDCPESALRPTARAAVRRGYSLVMSKETVTDDSFSVESHRLKPASLLGSVQPRFRITLPRCFPRGTPSWHLLGKPSESVIRNCLPAQHIGPVDALRPRWNRHRWEHDLDVQVRQPVSQYLGCLFPPP